ncbi:protein-glutamate O-methyltransferase [Eubacteriales bacterium OttesenSCG-928-K08]|nr:protein-glutamate O-methyltransferase [Eubacteriales bacterium OttesenSCG-928-K08]
MSILKITDAEFDQLVNYMYSRYGINLSRKRALIEGRLGMMLTQRGYTDYASYIRDILNDKTGQEVSTLVSRLTTNFTYFLREEGHYTFLTSHVFPQWKKAPLLERRIWSAACSSGEEPYSIAMVLYDYFGGIRPGKVAITASDISENVLSQARAGIYTADQIGKLPPEWTTRFFNRQEKERFEVKSTLKNLIQYKYFNLNDPRFWPKSHYDIIFCRNVMIYFDQPTKQAVINRLHDALRPGGFLLIGMSETLVNLKSEFKYIQPSIYQRL